MIKFFKKALVFIVVMYLIDKPVGFTISKLVREKQVDNRIELLEKGELTKDILILGSSRAVNDIDPEVISNKTGKSCYNLGYSGSNLNFHAAILKLILQKKHPKKIILTVDGTSTFVPNEKGIFRKDRLEPYLCYDDVLKIYTENSDKNYLACKLSWVFRENQNFFPTLDYLKVGMDTPDETTNINEFGVIFLEGDSANFNFQPFDNQSDIYDRKLEDEKLLGSFEEIINSCQANNIELTVIIPPVFINSSNAFAERLKEIVNDRCTILNYSTQIKDKSLYFDNGHLNKSGAQKISEIIASEIIQ